jgi:hypothetical protein
MISPPHVQRHVCASLLIIVTGEAVFSRRGGHPGSSARVRGLCAAHHCSRANAHRTSAWSAQCWLRNHCIFTMLSLTKSVLATDRPKVQRWYLPTGPIEYVSIASKWPPLEPETDDAHSTADRILQSAFQQAQEQYKRELTDDDHKTTWLHGKQSLDDVLRAIEDAKSQYEARPSSKARKWLNIVSSKVMHYGNTLEVLAQHHPEYVALVWGTFRLLFGVSHGYSWARQGYWTGPGRGSS